MLPLVDLEIYRGPLDLLLYLVRKHELDVADIAIARITDQFLEYLEVLEQLDVDMVGDFLEMASTLIEIKARMVLPVAPQEDEEEVLVDPRQDLVQRLLEYKRIKDAACVLEERSLVWQQRYGRLTGDGTGRSTGSRDRPVEDVEVWDLVSALGRVMRHRQWEQPESIVFDDTPIQVYMHHIHQRLECEGQLAFSDMFRPGMHKSAMIGVFLALLELMRHQQVRAEQEQLHGEIYLVAGPNFHQPLDDLHIDAWDGRTEEG